MSPEQKRRLAPAPQAEADPQAKWWEEEADRHNALGDFFARKGYQVSASGYEPGAGEAVAYLKSMPQHKAIQQAREWTGRTDIATLEDAITAVREALKDE